MHDGRIAADMTPDELLCSPLLAQHGIREPLYLTALKYAGVQVTPDMHPEHVNKLLLTEKQKEQVRTWFGKEQKAAASTEMAEPVLKV